MRKQFIDLHACDIIRMNKNKIHLYIQKKLCFKSFLANHSHTLKTKQEKH